MRAKVMAINIAKNKRESIEDIMLVGVIWLDREIDFQSGYE